jgi:hypothetical protein
MCIRAFIKSICLFLYISSGIVFAQNGPAVIGSAKVLGISGDVQASLAGVRQDVRPDQELRQGTRVEVAPGGFVSLRLVDGSIVRLYSDSNLQLQTLPSSGRVVNNANSTVLFLEKGSVDADVARKRASRRVFEVKSPLAVAGVRGTRFGVTVQDDGSFTGDVRRGRVGVSVVGGDRHRRFVELRAGRGVSVDPNTGLGETVTLLPVVPDVSIAPLLIDESAFLQINYSPVIGAARYQFQVARDENMIHVLRNGLFDQPEALFAGLPAGEYFVAVRALDSKGARGAEAVQALWVKRRVAAPYLLMPPSGNTSNRPGEVLQCGQVNDAARYHVQLSTDPEFNNKIRDEANLSQCEISVPAGLSGVVYWRVAASLSPVHAGTIAGADPSMRSPWSAVMQLHLKSGLIQEAKLLRQVIEPTSVAARVRYRVQIALDSSFVNVVRDQVLLNARLPLDLPSGQYHVRWKGLMPDQTESEFSVPQVVTVTSTQ